MRNGKVSDAFRRLHPQADGGVHVLERASQRGESIVVVVVGGGGWVFFPPPRLGCFVSLSYLRGLLSYFKTSLLTSVHSLVHVSSITSVLV